MEEINICILPNDEIANQAIKLSQKLSSNFPTEFVLGINNFIPHISLFHIGIPKESHHLLVKEVEDITKSIQSQTIEFLGYKNLDSFLFWRIIKTKFLISLQNQIIDKINPIRGGKQRIPIKEWKDDLNLSDDQLANVKKFGYPLVGSFFDPHITITRFLDINNTKKVMNSLMIKSEIMKVDKISIGLIGSHGTLPKILNTFEVKQ